MEKWVWTLAAVVEGRRDGEYEKINEGAGGMGLGTYRSKEHYIVIDLQLLK